jgi:hypothetical protein
MEDKQEINLQNDTGIFLFVLKAQRNKTQREKKNTSFLESATRMWFSS